MRSARLAKAIARGRVLVRNKQTGQVLLKFRTSNVKDRIFHPVALHDRNNAESYMNLSKVYSAEQLIASTLEDRIVAGDLELKVD